MAKEIKPTRAALESNFSIVWQIGLFRILVDTMGSVDLRSFQYCRTISSMRILTEVQSMVVRTNVSNRSGSAPAGSTLCTVASLFAYIAS